MFYQHELLDESVFTGSEHELLFDVVSGATVERACHKQVSQGRRRANMAHIRQSMPDFGLGVQVKFLKPFKEGSSPRTRLGRTFSDSFGPRYVSCFKKVDTRLPGKGISNSHGARPVY